jgi:hypothetical protein
MSECRSCHQPLIWVQTAAGESMPLNPRPVPGGNIELHNGVAHVVRPEPTVRRYTSHFANCPQANGHRKERRR